MVGGTVSAAQLIIVVVCIFLVVTLPTTTILPISSSILVYVQAAGSAADAAPSTPRQKKPRREAVHDHPNCVRHATLSTACTNELIAQNQQEADAGGFEDLIGAALHKRCLQLVTDLTKCNMLNQKATVEKDQQHEKEKKERGTTRHPCQPEVEVLEACHAEAKEHTATTPNQMEVLDALDQHCGEFAHELQRCMVLHATTTDDEPEHDLIEIVLEAEL